MLYYYWVKRGIRPSVFASMPYGERMVVRAFYEREIADIIRKSSD